MAGSIRLADLKVKGGGNGVPSLEDFDGQTLAFYDVTEWNSGRKNAANKPAVVLEKAGGKVVLVPKRVHEVLTKALKMAAEKGFDTVEAKVIKTGRGSRIE